ncbi:hypothetical protein Landi51_13015 [Colletotrichum acutatum]
MMKRSISDPADLDLLDLDHVRCPVCPPDPLTSRGYPLPQIARERPAANVVHAYRHDNGVDRRHNPLRRPLIGRIQRLYLEPDLSFLLPPALIYVGTMRLARDLSLRDGPVRIHSTPSGRSSRFPQRSPMVYTPCRWLSIARGGVAPFHTVALPFGRDDCGPVIPLDVRPNVHADLREDGCLPVLDDELLDEMDLILAAMLGLFN